MKRTAWEPSGGGLGGPYSKGGEAGLLYSPLIEVPDVTHVIFTRIQAAPTAPVRSKSGALISSPELSVTGLSLVRSEIYL